MRKLLERNGRWIGGAISLLALGAFIHAFGSFVSAQDAATMLQLHWPALLAALLLYGAAYIPMCLGWQVLARGSGAGLRQVAMLQIFLVSQIGKYLPGNFGHLLGRAYLARSHGAPLDAIGIAMTLEMIGVLAAGALFAVTAGLLVPGNSGSSTVPLAAAALALIMLALVLFLSRKRVAGVRALAGPILASLACYLGVFTLFSAAYVALLGGSAWPVAFQIAGAVVLSWLVGFMVPGAPAGLGLREFSFYTLLAGAFPQEAVLFAAAGMRLVTMVGDALAWLVGLAIGRASRQAVSALG